MCVYFVILCLVSGITIRILNESY